MAPRLWSVVLVGWLALLAGAAPAWGCVASALQGACCPANTSAPCPGGATVPISDELAIACCAAAPSPVAATAPALSRVDPAALTHEGTPDPHMFIAVGGAEARRAVQHARSLAIDIAPASNAAPIFLRTSRLRL